MLQPRGGLRFSSHLLLPRNPFLCGGSHNTGFSAQSGQALCPCVNELALGCAEVKVVWWQVTRTGQNPSCHVLPLRCLGLHQHFSPRATARPPLFFLQFIDKFAGSLGLGMGCVAPPWAVLASTGMPAASEPDPELQQPPDRPAGSCRSARAPAPALLVGAGWHPPVPRPHPAEQPEGWLGGS